MAFGPLKDKDFTHSGFQCPKASIGHLVGRGYKHTLNFLILRVHTRASIKITHHLVCVCVCVFDEIFKSQVSYVYLMCNFPQYLQTFLAVESVYILILMAKPQFIPQIKGELH